MSAGKNLDLLAWFDEAERDACSTCKRHAAVRLPEAEATFCLYCGAVWLGGRRLDTAGRIEIVESATALADGSRRAAREEPEAHRQNPDVRSP